eukprot:m.108116 g.108116  ORF g.108116 m.108116 type:complete len:100 (-) comp9245_c1_seq1:328-627(-)
MLRVFFCMCCRHLFSFVLSFFAISFIYYPTSQHSSLVAHCKLSVFCFAVVGAFFSFSLTVLYFSEIVLSVCCIRQDAACSGISPLGQKRPPAVVSTKKN